MAIVQENLHWTVCVSWHFQLSAGRFCWSKFYCAHVLADSCATNANENIDLVTTALHVWRLEGEIIRTAHCCVVYNCCAQLCAHKYQHFLNSCVVRFRLAYVGFFKKV